VKQTGWWERVLGMDVPSSRPNASHRPRTHPGVSSKSAGVAVIHVGLHRLDTWPTSPALPMHATNEVFSIQFEGERCESLYRPRQV
jgi:hypothetical protein